jgi:hypothetical protein
MLMRVAVAVSWAPPAAEVVPSEPHACSVAMCRPVRQPSPKRRRGEELTISPPAIACPMLAKPLKDFKREIGG